MRSCASAVLLWAILLRVPARGAAQELDAPDQLSLTLVELDDLHAQLGTPSAARRGAALGELLALSDEDLPSIRARLHAVAASPSDHKSWLSKLPALRRSRAIEAKASVDDQAVGLLAALEHDRSPAMVAVVELVAILRALERQHSIAAAELIANELFAVEPRLFRGELAKTRKRLGKLLVPGFLRALAQPNPALQKLARDGLSALGTSLEASPFAEPDPELLAATIQVQSEHFGLAPLPWFVALLDDARPPVRSAARLATQAHASDCLDLLRQRMADLTGEEPDPSWDAAHVLQRLLEQIDGTRDRRTTAALRAAQQALQNGALSTVEAQLAEALSSGLSPTAQALAAATYLALADKYDRLNRNDLALHSNRRALRFALERSEEARQARARVLYLEAEQRAGRGIADLHSLHTAAQLEPARPFAADLLQEELRGLRIDHERELRRMLGLAASALLIFSALLLLHMRVQARRERRLGSASFTR
ncbi:MAG: hypothetical protein JWN04_3889 [Myxococcaceae bacterium]|nr:hypothetical protein [Myxococcaceae bacterium]